MNKIVILLMLLLFVGCGSDNNSKKYIATPINTTENTNVNGDAVIVDTSGNVDVNVTKTENYINIDCGEGGCGDISIGTEVDNNENNESNESN